ncbi:MAG TPA: alpha/beta fold hydrolase [Thermoanaerobaculia bacterium]|nr:alpha/beta fold hydrolase [Thermoanaerobaculia bacterium]
MTFTRVAVSILLLTTLTLQAQSVEGYWEGALIRDGAVRIERVDIIRDGNALKASVMSGDWLAERDGVAVTQDGANVRIEIPDEPLVLVHDAAVGEMIGTTAATSTPPVRVHLKRALRPPTPAVHFEDVRFPAGDITIGGTIVTPATAGPHPLIVWLHGRGGTVRTGFRGFARRFAERGVASFIFDRRGSGESTGNESVASTYDLANDVIAAIEFLAKRPEVDRAQIGLRSNSAGGWIAPIVVTRSKVPVAFVIAAVGPADSVRDQQVHVAEYNMRRAGGFSEDEIAAAKAHMELVQDVAYTSKGWEALRTSNERAKTTRWAKFVDLPDSDAYEDIQWVRHKQYDPGPDLQKITVPYLALYGAADSVVPPEINVPKLERYLKAAGNRDYKIVVVPEAGHGLSIEDGVRKLPKDDYYWMWSKAAPLAIETQFAWLLAHVKTAK